jgi:hypothetical protein
MRQGREPTENPNLSRLRKRGRTLVIDSDLIETRAVVCYEAEQNHVMGADGEKCLRPTNMAHGGSLTCMDNAAKCVVTCHEIC